MVENIMTVCNAFLVTETTANDAKKLGLQYLGFGRFGKLGKVTHVSVNGKLRPVQGKVARHLTRNLKKLKTNAIKKVSTLVETSIPTSPDKWAKAKAAAKRKFKVYPSAYANLWAAKKYKSMGGGWKRGKK
jgi:hypothetical protein